MSQIAQNQHYILFIDYEVIHSMLFNNQYLKRLKDYISLLVCNNFSIVIYGVTISQITHLKNISIYTDQDNQILKIIQTPEKIDQQIMTKKIKLILEENRKILLSFESDNIEKILEMIQNNLMQSYKIKNIIIVTNSKIQKRQYRRIVKPGEKFLDFVLMEILQQKKNKDKMQIQSIEINQFNQDQIDETSSLDDIDTRQQISQQIKQINFSVISKVFDIDSIQLLLQNKYVIKHIKHLNVINRYSIYEFIISAWHNKINLKYKIQKCYKSLFEYMAFHIHNHQLQISQDEFLGLNNTKDIIKYRLVKVKQLKYSFLHQSILNFYAVNYIIKQIIQLKCDFLPHQIVKSSQICVLLKQCLKFNQNLEDSLLDIVIKSRVDKSIQMSAAAAITILNIVGKQFTGINFRGISIPYANLIGASFKDTNFEDSNLQNVIMNKSNCVSNIFNNSDMRGIQLENHTDIHYQQQISCIDIEKSGKYIVAVGRSGRFSIYERKSTKKVKQIKNTESIQLIKYSPDGIFITSISINIIKIWHIESGIIIKNLKQFSRVEIFSICYLTEKRIVIASQDKMIRLWDIQTLQNIKSINQFNINTSSVLYSLDDKRIVYISGNAIKVWNIQTQKNTIVFKNNTIILTFYLCTRQTEIIIVGSDKFIKIFNLKNEKTNVIMNDKTNICYICCTPDRQMIIDCDNYRNTISFWSYQTKKRISTLQVNDKIICNICCFPDGKTIISASKDNMIQIWNIVNYSHLYKSQVNNYGQNNKYEGIIAFDHTYNSIL